MISRLLPALLGAVALLPACKKPAVETYRVPKEPVAADTAHQHAHGAAAPNATPAASAPAANNGGAAMASTPVATASGNALAWTAPEQWKPKGGSSMRKGSYSVPGEGGEADMAITAFPGDVGGDLANLNRWRGQIGLPPVSQTEFESNIQRVEHNGLKMTVVDVAGTGPQAQRILGAMVPHRGATWFFKLQGPDAIVAKEKPAFMALLETVKPAQ